MKVYNLINVNNDGDMYYGYCKEEDSFIAWYKDSIEKDREYYLVNEYVEIRERLENVKINFVY